MLHTIYLIALKIDFLHTEYKTVFIKSCVCLNLFFSCNQWPLPKENNWNKIFLWHQKAKLFTPVAERKYAISSGGLL
jgi:hypothetical protein